MKTYMPRRATKRWTHDAPTYVLDVFDHPKFGDRYTVFLAGSEGFHLDKAGNIVSGMGDYGRSYLQYFGANEAPTHPQGVGMWGEMPAYDVANYRRSYSHKRIAWRDLPESVKACVQSACEATP